jgi:hypothetical protein
MAGGAGVARGFAFLCQQIVRNSLRNKTARQGAPVLSARRRPCSWYIRYAEVPGLDQKVPHPAGLVHVDLDKLACFTTAKFPTTSCIFTDQRLLDDQVRLG